MKTRHRRRSKNTASSLVVSLLVIVLLTVIVVAFVQTMSLARVNAKGYTEFRQATLAAEAGLDMAMAQLFIAADTNRAFVTGLTNYPTTNYSLTVIGVRDLTNRAQLMPLVSGPTNYLAGFGQPGWESSFSAYVTAATSANASVSIDLNTARHFIQQTNDANLYRAAWVVMTNTAGIKTNYSRFAYIMVDETARINPTLHAGLGEGLTNSTNWYSGPQDITLTRTNAEMLTAAQMAEVLANSDVFRNTDATLGQVFPNREAYEAVKHLFTKQTNSSYESIPGWFADGGKPKYNINDLATNTLYGANAALRAENIASIIGRNLTNFYQRDPALKATNTTKYLNRLAANIVDYIDADDQFTLVGGESTGMEISGFPYQFAERIRAVEGGHSIDSIPHSAARLETQYFVGVWNPYSKPVTIKTATIRVWNRPNYTFISAAGIATPEYRYTINPDQVLQANEYGALEFPTQLLPRVTSGGDTTTNPPVYLEAGPNNYVQYEFSINGQVISKTPGTNASKLTPGGGMEQDDTRTRDENILLGEYEYQHVLVGTNNLWMIRSLSSDATLSDPRFARLAHTVWGSGLSASSWTKTLWKGRALEYSTLWAQRDYLPRDGRVGQSAGSEANTPNSVTSQYQPADASAAPGVIRNDAMKSIGELGFIYDPAHAATDLSTNNPKGSDKLFSFKSPYQNGGGRTLRIGQPESMGSGDDNWNVSGRRAIELLDLFTIDSDEGAKGRINPNTASTLALTAILGGIKVKSDTGDAERGLADPLKLANLIITNRPYSSISDLYKITSQFISTANYDPAPAYYLGAGMARFPKMADSTREEAFGKLVSHLTVQSRAYRVYVIGQVLDQTQNPRGSVVLEASVFLRWDEERGRFQPEVQYVNTLK